jgi:class 3 adenylate cyclase
MDSAAVRIRLRDAQIRLASAELQLNGDSPHEWKHAAELSVRVGIAAGDAICGHVLRYKPSGDAHIEAIATLRPAGNAATAQHLDTLLAATSAQS